MDFLKKTFNQIFTNKIFRKIFSALFLNRYLISKTNYIYEFSPHIFQEMFIRLAIIPNFDFYWTIYLANDKKIKVYVSKDYTPSFSFAISYKWHDIGIRKLEILLNNFYPLNHCYIDIGANLGLRSIYALSQGRFAYLFEPNKNLNKFVINLLNINSLNSYKLVNLCVSDEDGIKRFYISPSSYLSSLSKQNALNDTEEGVVEEIKVKVTTLDKYFDNSKIVIGIIKIDVEGHEYEVLKGMENILEKFSPDLIVEILCDSKKKSQIYSFMEKHLYRCFAILNKNELTLIEYKNVNTFSSTHFANNYFFTKNMKCLSGVTILNKDNHD